MYPTNFPMLALAALLLTNAAHAAAANPPAAPVNKPHAMAEIDQRSAEKKFDENGSKYHCHEQMSNSVMIWRTHENDENGKTTAQCATFKQLGEQLKYEKAEAEVFSFSQSNYPDKGQFKCPNDKLVVGREHDGDENGETRYYCRALVGRGNEIVKPDDRYWGELQNENEFDFKCGENEALTGFHHVGDENGASQVQCAKLY